jgi:methionine biosynthesis protein MetW
VSFPNFGHWSVRGYLATRGRMPVSRSIPYTWYDTPNIHHTTIKDFRDFVTANGGELEREIPLLTQGWHRAEIRRVNLWPNMLADTAVAVVRPQR